MRRTTLATERHLADGTVALVRQCQLMRALHDRNGPPPLRKLPAGFAGVARIIVGQQLSAQSAAAIWSRVEAGVAPCNADTIARSTDAQLTGFGLSAAKVRTLRALADAVHTGRLSFAALSKAPDDVVTAKLTDVHGIGPWTADIYLLFALRRRDAFAAGDLALQIAAQRLFELASKPSPAELTELAERWRPWRGVAARMLWDEYGLQKSRGRTTRNTAPAKR